jgi:DNA-binding transcriptional regulator YiaG|nr:transcriptional regulator [Stutzerimonas stutzeri]
MYEYKGAGLPGIFLKNGYTLHETPYGPGVSFEDIDGLHRAIAADIVRQKTPMTGSQFRFLRKEQDLVQGELAGVLRVDVQTIANWEKKGDAEVPGPADVAMRAFYSAFMHIKFGPMTFESPSFEGRRAVFERHDQSWTEAVAA